MKTVGFSENLPYPVDAERGFMWVYSSWLNRVCVFN